MKASHTYRRPHRALAVRLIDFFGGLWRGLGLPLTSLDEESLLDFARRKTGLSDFGADDFREPLRVWLAGLENDAHLTPFGRMLARFTLTEGLCNRLRVQHQLNKHPEILKQPVRRPLIIVSMPRSGTTLLYRLLAQDPVSRPLLTWEAAYPAPLGRSHAGNSDPRIRRCAFDLWRTNRMAPSLPAIYRFESRGPSECHPLLRNTFVYAFAMVMRSYRQWFRSLPDAAFQRCYLEYRQQLQVIQWQRPPKGRWLLKSPVHLWTLGPLLETLPDAAVVQTHRDLRKSIPSFCSLCAVVTGMFTDNVRPTEMGPVAVELGIEAISRAQRARDTSDSARFYDLTYARLVADPVSVIQGIYRKFGYEYTPEFERRVQRYLAGSRSAARGKHGYDLAQFGLDQDAIEKAFEPYHQRYGIQREA